MKNFVMKLVNFKQSQEKKLITVSILKYTGKTKEINAFQRTAIFIYLYKYYILTK